jgi:hypothetical protein
VYTPFCAGCGAITLYPHREQAAERPRCVLGLFDVSARLFVSRHELTFAAPMRKFATMVANMEDSFLTTASWNKVQRRIAAEQA